VFFCVFVRERISGTTCPIFTKIFTPVTDSGGSVLLWVRCDTLCISGFMDDVFFENNGKWPEGTKNRHTLKLTQRRQQGFDMVVYTETEPPGGSTEPGAKSDIYDCLV